MLETLYTFCLVTEEILLLTFFVSLHYWQTSLLGTFVGTFTVMLALTKAFTNAFGHTSQRASKNVSATLTLKCFTYQQYFSLPQSGVFNIQSSWDTPKKTCFVERVSFYISNIHISTPSPLFNVVTMWRCPLSVFQNWKGGQGGLAIDKKDFFEFKKGHR